ncbi:MAG: pre-16S rRNA-processing nuclease YqgF [Okeania sp. SIO2G4]|uniref:pre-16S rRNA-processing nuclease YqgF n=1 Tax=unclassified Okeania TaxID=2634635 RepID=UPI0013BBC026|nr:MULTISPECIES: pre-16S rRNA-processing nuclease YqgF [unclassified Okeania]NEP05900.1 pre-16S rRNA-processing nuclease YqgF [Okeania sp. SIO4D6]NEP38501.1 pre-16S rRNA-processing nuclease YqgF [Okeania sp. SIO2H7]NEP71137.1 pre-16S rRNA-processing nuclease YqgF [Okeania sp. SIO2G5]NEP92052.1 pre-16S rRNA-processing nuclease YqgF [Okeania sp. SIO2F5]NEQ90167.1 pre-16S rRNA-processing nuclease YqgF [Okeania sp. SIO2G4]
MILGFDPGSQKCGIALMDRAKKLHYHQVIESLEVVKTIKNLYQKFDIDLIVIGDQTTSKIWKQSLTKIISKTVPIIKIDERYSSLEARDRYWQMYPPQGIFRLIPPGMRIPPKPVDDIVAIILIERYLKNDSLYSRAISF